MKTLFFLLLLSVAGFARPLQPVSLLPFYNLTQSSLLDAEGMRKATAQAFQEMGYLVILPEAVDTAVEQNAVQVATEEGKYLLAEILRAESFFQGSLVAASVKERRWMLRATYEWLDKKGRLLSRATADASDIANDKPLEEVLFRLYKAMAKKAVKMMSAAMKTEGIVLRRRSATTLDVSFSKEDGVGPGSLVRLEDGGSYVGSALLVEVGEAKSLAVLTEIAAGRRPAPNQTIYLAELKALEQSVKKTPAWLKKTGRWMLTAGMIGAVLLIATH